MANKKPEMRRNCASIPLVKRDLLGARMHSHEEDANGLTIFRPSTFAFPLSRGRKAFSLRANGTYIGTIPGPTDRPAPTSGRWALALPAAIG